MADGVRIDQVKAYSSDSALADITSVTYTNSGGEGEAGPNETVEVLVLYTQEALNKFGSLALLQSNLKSAFHCESSSEPLCVSYGIEYSVNGLLEASQVKARVSLIAFLPSPVNDVGNDLNDIFITARDSQEVRNLRDQYKADAVLLLSGSSEIAPFGLTTSLHSLPSGTSFETINATTEAPLNIISDAAFLVAVKYTSATYSFRTTIAHEFGHLLGAAHQISQTPLGLEPWSHAFIVPGKVRTIESTFEDCIGCEKLVMFSNPRIFVTLTSGEVIKIGN
jgi:hypothetical protein